MIEICHLTSVHSIDDVRIFTKECTSLAANGFDVTIIACSDVAFEDVKNGVKRISLKVPVKNLLQRFIKRSKAVYKKAIEVDADIYHFHDPELLPLGLKLKNKGKKVIFDSHEFYGEQIKEKDYIPKPIRWLTSYIYMKYEEYVCKRIDATIQVCTLAGKNYFEKRAKKTIFIANTPIFKGDNKENIVSFETKESAAYIGGLTFNRGITNIIKAAAIADVNLILGGIFFSNKYHAELKTLNEYSIVNYKGFLNDEQIQDILNICFAGLSTLLHISQYHKIDTFPTKVYNYMAAGIPVIISDTKYAKRIVEKYKIGICVNPTNIEEIANALIYLKNNKDVAKQMGANGRAAFEKTFNWQIEEKKIIELYRTL